MASEKYLSLTAVFAVMKMSKMKARTQMISMANVKPLVKLYVKESANGT